MAALKRFGAATLGLLVVFTGCVKNRPRMPAPINPAQSVGGYKVSDFQSDLNRYKAFLSATPPNLASARRQRDLIINRIVVDLESDYKEYEIAVFAERAKWDTAGDILELTLTGATTISNGARVKTVLAAVLSGVKGSRLSYAKNYYREKTAEIIISKMQASRNVIRNQIVDKMTNLDVDKYPFEEAWVDLIDFFYAGTLEGGIQALAVDAGSSVAAANAKTEQSVQQRIKLASFSAKRLQDITDIRVKFNELMQTHNVAAARKILTSLGVEIAADAAEKDVFAKLNEEIRKAVQDPAVVDKLALAFGLQ